MRASYNWLKELLPTLAASPSEVAKSLGDAGIAVDGVQEVGAELALLIVVAVRAKEAHPKRANLTLVTVDLGGQEQRVVCGASNVPEPGALLVLAPLGARLPGMDAPLTPREIGGVLSEACCAVKASSGSPTARTGS